MWPQPAACQRPAPAAPLTIPSIPPPPVASLDDKPTRRATINRYGFNSAGADAAAERLERFWRRVEADPSRKPGLLAINLGKNKATADAADDYALGAVKLARYADFLVVNVSSPNTPGLRALQGRRELEALVRFVQRARDGLEWGPRGPPPLLVKIAPDLTDDDKADIAAVAAATKVDGLVVSNTTVARPPEIQGLTHAQEAGGLSGPPLMEPSTRALSDMYRLTGGKVPLVGCGGVTSGEDAYRKIRAGASLVELYTALAYEGARSRTAQRAVWGAAAWFGLLCCDCCCTSSPVRVLRMYVPVASRKRPSITTNTHCARTHHTHAHTPCRPRRRAAHQGGARRVPRARRLCARAGRGRRRPPRGRQRWWRWRWRQEVVALMMRGAGAPYPLVQLVLCIPPCLPHCRRDRLLQIFIS